LLLGKWWFDELYEFLFVEPVHRAAAIVTWIDKQIIDRILDNLAVWTVVFSRCDDYVDRRFVDGLFNGLGDWTWNTALSLRTVQSGRLRQYVVYIAVGTVGLFVLVSLLWNYAQAAGGH
jgi:NADH:ubiquinone oxidoreductase subunit 5 (subunit L)/multisubunit Na+/H+ antiporter MnhA subunit